MVVTIRGTPEEIAALVRATQERQAELSVEIVAEELAQRLTSYLKSRGNLRLDVPASIGYCIRRQRQRRAMDQPCKHFETPEEEVGN